MAPTLELQDRSEFKARMNEILTIDPRKTVLLTVDMQYNYLDMEEGASPVLPDEAERVLTHAKVLLDFARQEEIPVVHVYVARRQVELNRSSWTYGKDGRDIKLSQSPHASLREMGDRPEGSKRSQVPVELVAPSDIHVTTKRTMDAYFGSDLDMLLSRALKPEAVVITGINTDTCVYATAFSTSNRGYRPIVISDCVASTRGKDSHQMALELMARSIAWVLTVEEFKQKVQTGARVAVS